MIKFSCSNCNHCYKVPDKYAGKKAKCKKCGSIIKVPAKLAITPELFENYQPAPDPNTNPKISNADDTQHANTETTPQNIQPDEELSEDYKEVIDEIKKLDNPNRSWIKNAAILVVSLFVFFHLGFVKGNLSYIIALILVLFIHEGGHLIGMYLFGYKNLQMFFIPFLGAAVSGQSKNVDSYKKAIVSLLGPGPGIFLSVIVLLIYVKNNNEFLLFLANLLFLINIFNLLPFYPLDGGRFFNEILFSRNRYVEVVFNAIASLALIGLGLLLKFWLLTIIGIFNLISLIPRFKVSSIASEIKESDMANLIIIDETSHTKTNQIHKYVIDRIRSSIDNLSPKSVASYTKNIIETVRCRPPKIMPTIALLALYLFFCLTPLMLFAVAVDIKIFNTIEIVDSRNDNGDLVSYEQISAMGRVYCKTELSEDEKLYHGESIAYNYNGTISRQGRWLNGRRHGELKAYDDQGDPIWVTVYDKGEFVSRKELNEDGQWIDVTWDQLPPHLKNLIERRNADPPLGPGMR